MLFISFSCLLTIALMNEIEDTMSMKCLRKRANEDQPSTSVFKQQKRHTRSQQIVNTSDTTKLASDIRGTKQDDRSSEVVSEGKCYLLAKTSAQWKDQDSPKAEKHNYVPSATKIYVQQKMCNIRNTLGANSQILLRVDPI